MDNASVASGWVIRGYAISDDRLQHEITLTLSDEYIQGKLEQPVNKGLSTPLQEERLAELLGPGFENLSSCVWYLDYEQSTS
jgi:6,7-dimethyl-8-ribityllumazine synthase